MDDTTANNTAPKQRSRWRRFRLRTLLLVVLLIQVPLIWYVHGRHRAHREDVAVQRLFPDGTGSFSRGTDSTSGLQKWLFRLGLEPHFYGVTLVAGEYAALGHSQDDSLVHLPALRHLVLQNTQIPAQTIIPSRLQHLQVVNLSGSSVPPRFIESLAECRALDQLALGDCLLSSHTLIAIGDLKQLRLLSMSRCMVGYWDSDTLVREQGDCSFLYGMSNLQHLNISEFPGNPPTLADLPESLVSLNSRKLGLDLSKQLAVREHLTGIELFESSITAANVRILIPHCPKLNYVGLLQTRCTEEDISSLSSEYPSIHFR